VITGNAVEQGAEYGGRKNSTGIEGDETEDLLDLLSTVKVLVASLLFNSDLILSLSIIILKSKAYLLVLSCPIINVCVSNMCEVTSSLPISSHI
jgi:ABC-type siderophore export system fused ATPase/permease subunit